MMIEQKEIKINIPEGYEIDKENSTFECVKFKPAKKYLTLFDVHEKVSPILPDTEYNRPVASDRHKKVIAYASLSEIAEYYNQGWKPNWEKFTERKYSIGYDADLGYRIEPIPYNQGEVVFKNEEDAKTVLRNPNFREILDTLFK